MSANKIQIIDKINGSISGDELLDLIKMVATQSEAKIDQIKLTSDNLIDLKITPKSSFFGFKGTIKTEPKKNDQTYIQVSGKISVTKWIWYLFYVIVMFGLLIIPPLMLMWFPFMIWRVFRSRGIARKFANDLPSQIRMLA